MSSLVPTQEVLPKIQTNEDFRMYQYSGYDELKFKRFFRMILLVRGFSCLKSWLQQSPKVSKYFFVHAKLQLNERTARELMAYALIIFCTHWENVIDIRQVPQDREAQSFGTGPIDQELDKAQLKFPPLSQGDLNRFKKIVCDFLRSDDRILISDSEYIAGPSDIVVVIAHQPRQGVEMERTPIRRVITQFVATQQTDGITNME